MNKRRMQAAVCLLLVLLFCGISVPASALIKMNTQTLVNTFDPGALLDMYATVEIGIQKTISTTAEKTISPAGFAFVLEKVGGETEPLSVQSDELGRAAFELNFDIADVGEHVYRLYEVKGKRAGVTYDAREYELRVNVAVENDVLGTEIFLDGQRVESCVAAFVNRYTPPAQTGSSFPFELYAAVLAISGIGCVLLRRMGEEE